MMRLTQIEMSEFFERHFGQLLRGQLKQIIYEQSATRRYQVGSRLQQDMWTLHYAHALNDVALTYRLLADHNVALAANELILTKAAAAGQTQVAIPDAASGAHYYENGHIECWPAGGAFEQHRIKDSGASDGVNVVLILYDPLITALSIGDMVLPTPSIYQNVGPMPGAYPGRETAAGLNLLPITNGNYFWLVTWGPVFISCQAGGWPGDAANCKDVFCWSDGTVAHLAAWGAGTYDGGTNSPQRVGYGLPSGDYGSGKIMLQLSP